MKRVFFFLFLLVIATACRDKTPAGNLTDKLIKTMSVYLYKQVNNDSSKVKYKIEEVAYFTEKKIYTCDFKVRMILPGRLDTTGIMRAYISKDFKEIKRVD
jgi:hypothetical protein